MIHGKESHSNQVPMLNTRIAIGSRGRGERQQGKDLALEL